MTERKICQFAEHVDAVLSQNFMQHGCDLRQPNITAFYETCNHLDVTNCCIVNFRS